MFSGRVDALKPAAIQTVDVPPVSAELAARMTAISKRALAGFAGWSPDGKGILIRTQFGNSMQLHRVYEPGGRRERIAFFEEPVEAALFPRPRRRDLVGDE